MIGDKNYPYICFFIGPEGLTWGKLLGERTPSLVERGKAANVILKNHHSFLRKTHVVPNVNTELMFDVPIVVNGEKQEYRARIFLHDYYGNRLEGQIPLRAQFLLDQMRDKVRRLKATIAGQAKEMYEIRGEYEKKLDRERQKYKKMRETFYTKPEEI